MLTAFMHAVSAVGSAAFYVPLLAILYWCAAPRLAALDANVAEAANQLSAVAPDLRSVATRIDALDRQIGVLADALAPLQGPTERIGRIVDRLPDRSRRIVARPTPES